MVRFIHYIIHMENLNKLPKLLCKNDCPDFSKRGNKTKPTSQDVEDWVETLQWLSDILISIESKNTQGQ